jgi:hypothetical protein
MLVEPTPEYGRYEVSLDSALNYINETTGESIY